MALTIEVKVIPQAGKYEWQQDKDGNLKCYLKAAPEKGAANKELIKNLSKQLKILQQDIEIIKGILERKKIIKIHKDIEIREFLQKVGIQEKQRELF